MCGPKPDELIGWEASMLMTGKEYLDSIRDGRRVYIGGEVVEDVTAHPAFRNAARSFAMIYDRKRDPENRDSSASQASSRRRTTRFTSQRCSSLSGGLLRCRRPSRG